LKFHRYNDVVPYTHIWAFGSNLSGIHGAGAAKVAKNKYGAIYGNPRGLQGNSYAIPTKDKRLKTLPLDKISEEVKTFCEFVIARPDLNFFVTRVGCGLAGYKDEQIAPMFKSLSGETNVSFDGAWKYYLLQLHI